MIDLQRHLWRGSALPALAMVLMLGGCTGAFDKLSDAVPKTSDITTFDWTPYTKASNSIPPSFGRRAATPADFVNADGSCAGAPISFAAGVNYTLTTNDFTASGGDSYPNFRARMTTRDTLDQDLADYIDAQGGSVSPAIQHRIHCTDSAPATGNACPVGSP